MSGIPSLSWPVHLDAAGRFATCEQDSIVAAQESVARLGVLEQGELDEIAPALGLPALEGLTAPPTGVALERLIEDQEPAATVTVLRMPEPGEGWERLQVLIGLAGNENA
jgi:hypothetical protein